MKEMVFKKADVEVMRQALVLCSCLHLVSPDERVKFKRVLVKVTENYDIR